VSPRALKDSVRPWLSLGAGVRPINFTVRCRWGQARALVQQ
jgi:hypothetical protein